MSLLRRKHTEYSQPEAFRVILCASVAIRLRLVLAGMTARPFPWRRLPLIG
jgi:hypothetical protein